jgi:hypothetical protein
MHLLRRLPLNEANTSTIIAASDNESSPNRRRAAREESAVFSKATIQTIGDVVFGIEITRNAKVKL